MDDNYRNIEPKTQLWWLNKHNGAAQICYDLQKKIMQEFKGKLTAAIMGSAYGGELEALGTLWRDRGTVYGFDTFEELHPDHLAVDRNSDEARCMDHWYLSDIYGIAPLAYDYQRGVLDSMGLDNVILVKGEVSKDSCKDISKIHYALLDMDMIAPMKTGYEAMKDRFVKGGYLCIHDILPEVHLGGYIYNWWYDGPLKSDGWEIVAEHTNGHLGIYRKL